GAAILQTRDDKDEPITLAAAVQWDESSGLFLPTHKENPLEVRVRELEAKLDELKQTIESGVQLKGSIDVLTVMDAVAITDTNRDWSDVVDLALYKRISIFVIDTLNAEKRIRLWPHQSDSAYRGWIYNERDNSFSQYIEVTLGPDQY